MTKPTLLYVTDAWGIHDDRWISTFRLLGYNCRNFLLDSSGDTLQDLNATLPSSRPIRTLKDEAVASSPLIVGPLTLNISSIASLPFRKIGLSWGFDLLDSEFAQHSLTATLPLLNDLIVDSTASYDAVRPYINRSQRCLVLPWGIDPAQYSVEGDRFDFTELGLPKDARVVLSLRRLEALYNVDAVLHAFAKVVGTIPDIHLVIGNSGPLEPQLRDLASTLKIEDRVHFAGWFPDNSLPKLLRAASLYVSAARTDGTSVTLLQALACGCPCVVSNTPGNRCWVDGEKVGALFEIGDIRSLSQGMIDALRGGQDTDAGRLLVESGADWNRNVDELRRFLLEATISGQ